MIDYIERVAALNKIYVTDMAVGATLFEQEQHKIALNEIPAADVRPVVLCRNCYLHDNCTTEDIFKFARLAEDSRFCGVGSYQRNSADMREVEHD